MLLARYREIVTEVKRNCRNYVWDYNDAEDFLSCTELLFADIENFCEANNIDFIDLKMAHLLNGIIDLFNGIIDDMEENEKDEYKINLRNSKIDKLKLGLKYNFETGKQSLP